MQIFSHIFCFFLAFLLFFRIFSHYFTPKSPRKARKKHLTFVGCFRWLRWYGVSLFGRCGFGVVRYVPCVHLGLEFDDFLVCYVGGFAVVIFGVLKEHREEVFDGLSFTIPHRVHCSEHGFGDELVTEAAPSAVATDDAQHLPIAQFVQELMRTDTYLAHDQLVDVAGGGQFFPAFPFPLVFGSSPGSSL